MQKKPVADTISRVITAAAHAAGWSLAKLARHLGMDENRLLRWRKGTVRKYDLNHVIVLFNLAGLSMDEEFGLVGSRIEPSEALDIKLDEMRTDIDQLQQQLQQLAPSASMLAAFASAFAVYEAAGGQEQGSPTDRGKAYSDLSALRRTSRQAQTAGRQLAQNIEGSQNEPAGEEAERGA